MPKLKPVFFPGELDPSLLEKLAFSERACLILSTLIAGANLVVDLKRGPGGVFLGHWKLMQADSVLCVLLIALSLHLSEPRNSRGVRRISLGLALLAALLGVGILCEREFHLSLGVDLLSSVSHGLRSQFPERMPLEAAGGFALLGIAAALSGARKRFPGYIADSASICLAFLLMILVSGYYFGTSPRFGPPAHLENLPQTLLCLALLTLSVLIRRAEHGVLSIVIGTSFGSRIARALLPVVLILPYLREAARAHFINSRQMPPHYTTALLASVAAMVGLALVLYLAWRIHEMESEIQDLSLRDSLTGLYNLRGFHLLAEQALRLAHRSEQPFSVLFIDLDNLKQINDALGHQVGSGVLAETGEILAATFRETDVLGRIGGDEFAVAGHFDEAAIARAAQRLKDSAAIRNAEGERRFALSFSIGYVTSEDTSRDSLDELLAKADRAMYLEKRQKKMQFA